MKLKRSAAAVLAAALACTQLAAAAVLPAAPASYAVTAMAADSADRYFSEQLPDDAVVYYEAIEEMYRTGLLKTGSGNLDLTEAGFLTQQQAEAIAENGAVALSMFGAARDAFAMEHTDTFYVNFDSFSIRVTHDGTRYHVYLGTGRYDSYYAAGFSSEADVNSALAAYEAAVSQIAADARASVAEDEADPIAAQVRYVHDFITHSTSYRLENACRPENLGLIRNACGPLLGGEGVCEGYSRAFKAVMDALGIPCVLVNGVYIHDGNIPELHMWTEVQIDGVWYGVDPTMDDPKAPAAARSLGTNGYESQEYLLVGSGKMDVHHSASGIISEANYEFAYPTLQLHPYGYTAAYENSDLTLLYTQDAELDGEQVDAFYVSYKGMGLEAARNEGYYLLCKMWDYRGIEPEWFYVVDYYDAMVDTETDLYMPIPGQITGVQFCVTTLPFEMYDEELGIADSVFYGTEDDILVTSEVYYNSNGGYVPPPYPKSVTPTMTCKLTSNNSTFHVSAAYNDVLVPVEGEEPGVVIDSTGPTAVQYSSITNFEWDGESTVNFDFKPSPMYADESVLYYLTLSGLVGELSGKAPIALTYGVSFGASHCPLRANGFNWTIFGQPALIDNSDVSTNGWMTSDGEAVDEMLQHRMVLVASSTTPEQTEQMNDLMNAESAGNILKSETYNISLTICQKMVIKTGEAVKVSIGFPAGYGPEDEGVTFKAYHFMKDDDGNVTGVEEIPCVVTKYGLIVMCNSFSPFAVAAVRADGAQTEKAVVITRSTGGTVSDSEQLLTLSAGDTHTLDIAADAGFVIDSVTVGGKRVAVTDKTAMQLTVSYEDFADADGIVDVIFAAESVVAQEEARGETALHVDAQLNEAEPLPEETETAVTTTATTAAPTVATTAETSAVTETTAVSVTTTAETAAESSAAATETTAATTLPEAETTETVTTTAQGGDLPQTGRPFTFDGMFAAFTLLGAGSILVSASGAVRKKDDES